MISSLTPTQVCPLQFEQLPLSKCHEADDCAVVIDVLRAFTTAAVAFDKGVEKIILTETIARAKEIYALHQESLLMGEEEGNMPKGQHFISGDFPHYPKEDLDYACNVDAYNFAMEVTREGDLHVMRKIIFV